MSIKVTVEEKYVALCCELAAIHIGICFFPMSLEYGGNNYH